MRCRRGRFRRGGAARAPSATGCWCREAGAGPGEGMRWVSSARGGWMARVWLALCGRGGCKRGASVGRCCWQKERDSECCGGASGRAKSRDSALPPARLPCLAAQFHPNNLAAGALAALSLRARLIHRLLIEGSVSSHPLVLALLLGCPLSSPLPPPGPAPNARLIERLLNREAQRQLRLGTHRQAARARLRQQSSHGEGSEGKVQRLSVGWGGRCKWGQHCEDEYGRGCGER